MTVVRSILFFNDRYIAKEDAKVSLLDQGLLRGDGLFETIRICRGRIPLLSDHLERLYRSADAVGISMPWPKNACEEKLQALVERNSVTEGRMRLVVTRGEGLSMDPFGETLRPNIFAMVEDLPEKPTEDDICKGVAIVTVPVFLQNGLFPFSIKSTSYFFNMAAKRFAKSQGAFEAIFTHPNGTLIEGSTSTLMWVRRGQIEVTPLTEGALPGITMKTLRRLLSARHESIAERTISLEELDTMDEVFMTSSILGIVPVKTVNQKPLRETTWPKALELRRLFQKALL